MSTVREATKEDVLDALRKVKDPDLNRDIVSLGFVTKHAVCDGLVDVVINLTTPACPVKDQLKKQAEDLLRALPGVKSVKVEMTAVVKGSAGPARPIAPQVKHFIAVSSGKGGVGKSTLTVNLAIALHQTGARVGILDCDVYGPDIPMMMGLNGSPEAVNRRLIPKQRHGIKTMSIGYLVEDEKPIVWRGPMVHKLIEQFLADVEWGELDYLLVDMPPGTGDAQLSLAQIVPLTGAVLVTTPQAVSTFDVGKAIAMFKQVNVPVLGIVENMAGYVVEGRVEGAAEGAKMLLGIGAQQQELRLGPGGSFRSIVHLFGQGGGEQLATKHGFELLGRVPLNPAVRVGGDAGDPVTIADPASPISEAFRTIAGRFAQAVAKREYFHGSGGGLPILQ
jgi:ATP-binding protein involved in chromosome partitioning